MGSTRYMTVMTPLIVSLVLVSLVACGGEEEPTPTPAASGSALRQQDVADALRQIVSSEAATLNLNDLRRSHTPLAVDEAVRLLSATKEARPSIQAIILESANSGGDPTSRIARLIGTDDVQLLAPLLEYVTQEMFFVSGDELYAQVSPFKGLYPKYVQWKQTAGFGTEEVLLPGGTEEYAAFFIAKHIADLVAPGTGDTVGWIISKDPDLRRLVVQGSIDIAFEGERLLMASTSGIELLQVSDRDVYILSGDSLNQALEGFNLDMNLEEALGSLEQAATDAGLTADDVASEARAEWDRLSPQIERELGRKIEELQQIDYEALKKDVNKAVEDFSREVERATKDFDVEKTIEDVSKAADDFIQGLFGN